MSEFIPNIIGATVTRSNSVDDNEIPRSDAMPHVSANCHCKFTKPAICSAQSLSGRSTSDEL